MGQGQGPQTQVGGSIGHCSKAVLNGMDGLVDESFP